jgi:predicted TIM-barrel fold metal-dependent hydrolase
MGLLALLLLAAPIADHHQHLVSPAVAAMISTQPITAKDLIAQLDAAGIQRALVLSVAYMYGSPARAVEDEYTKVRAENDWTAAQVAQYPDRLRAFCGFNPLKDYALAELSRCAADPILRRGIKLHFGNSDVQLENPEHLKKLKDVFRTANEHRMAIVVHLHANINNHRPYGAEQARIFLDQLLPLVPDVPVQIAHLAGAGGYNDPATDAAMAVFAGAVQRHDRRTRRLWFDVTTVANAEELSAETQALVVKRIRQVGLDRVVYGSDASAGGNTPANGWAAFRKLPLTAKEFDRIGRNLAPYMR